jgi:hypothetical protein
MGRRKNKEMVGRKLEWLRGVVAAVAIMCKSSHGGERIM